MTVPDDEKELVNAVRRKLVELREAMRNYTGKTGKPPKFLLEMEAAPLPSGPLAECKVFGNRFDMISSLAIGGRGAEVGVQHGYFSQFLLEKVRPTELHLFDLTERLIIDDVRKSPAVTIHVGDSSTKLSSFPDGYFDWIYIDGDHSYRGALRDAQVAAKKIKDDGILFFNDYLVWSATEMIPYGVMAVVNELVVAQGFHMIAIALASHGYFDVALKRKS